MCSLRKMADNAEVRVSLILASNQHCNILVDLLEELLESNGDKQIQLIEGLTKLFVAFINRKLWHFLYEKQLQTTSETDREDIDTSLLPATDELENINETSIADAERIFASWVHGHYVTFVNFLLTHLQEGDENQTTDNRKEQDSRMVALASLFNIMKADSKAVMRFRNMKGQPYFARYLLSKVVTVCLNQDVNSNLIEDGFLPYLEYTEVQFHTIECIYNTINLLLKEGNSKAIVPVQFSHNLLLMLENVKRPKEAEHVYFLLVSDDGQESTTGALREKCDAKYKHKTLQKAYSKAWLATLRLNHAPRVIRRILNRLHTKVMPHIDDPRLLLDFLTDSYNTGGVTSILALNGLFILINKFNLDYPDFYKKLYSLLQDGILDAKYKERFFHLTDLFLKSTHLPGYLVASFIKKIARIALVASPHGACVGIKLIHNLIKRHSSCKVLLHRRLGETSDMVESGGQWGLNQRVGDPYDITQSDPAQSRALESSLWELQTLEEHYHHSVYTALQELKKPITREEHCLNSLLDTTYFDLMESEMKDAEDGPMNFVKSDTLFDLDLYGTSLPHYMP